MDFYHVLGRDACRRSMASAPQDLTIDALVARAAHDSPGDRNHSPP